MSESRSMQRRKAAQKGAPMPTFSAEPAYTEQDCKDSSGEPIEVKLIAAASNGLVEVTPEKFERVGKLIRSYAALERAGMREACAKHQTHYVFSLQKGIITHAECACGLELPTIGACEKWVDHILSLPDLAADEAIERIKAEAERKGQVSAY